MALTLISRGDGVRRFHSVGRWSEEEGLVVHRTLFPPPSKTFRGRTLKLGVINKPRVFQKVAGTGEVVGYSSDILRLLQKHLNFTVALRWFDTFGAAYPNGSWNGVIGALHRKEIDFSPMDFTPTKESRTVIDFSDWVSENPVVITSAAPTPQVRPFLLLEVYKAEVSRWNRCIP
ncbi:glutamate receptor ionotropic, kainate 5-like [Eriocheir sinensis]|uniref:glutamate receptor ionotropic, kainate 5-like n=1 Tax=Eriocheir sinensis TaxID=95602 RepID=UPI0021C8FAEE|nr:glutamate receptor ionotropic, kainate 5-like [Eriocheir sinensis]